MSLEVRINDISFESPLMNAAGVLGTTGSSLRRIAKKGAGAVVTKTISPKPKEGNKGPVLVEMDYGMLNSMGLPNPGVESYKKELKAIEDIDKPIICSIFGQTPQEMIEVAEKLHEYVSIFELNLSCPNIEKRIICSDKKLSKEYVKKLDSITDKPIWAKLSPSTSNLLEVSKAISNAGADSLVLINTIKGMLVDHESGRPILSNKTGGLSGKAIHPIALEKIYRIYEKIDIPIVGVGGVSNYEEALEMFMVGARAIQIGTAIKDDIKIFNKINKNLRSFLDKKNVSSINEVVGISHNY